MPSQTKPFNDSLKESNHERYRAFLLVYLILFTLIVFGTFHSFGIFLKPLAEDLNIGRAEVSAAISISWICHGIFAALGGILSDRYGPRPVLASGTVLIGLGYALMSTCSSIAELYLYFGVIIGTGMGPAFVVTSATASKWFSRRRGLMLGIVLAGPGLGRVILAPLSHYLIRNYQIHTAYLILGILVLCVALPLGLLIRPAPKEKEASGNAAGEEIGERTAGSSGIREAIRHAPFWLLFSIWLLVPFAIQLWQVHFFPHVSDKGIPETAASFLFVFSGAGLIIGRISWGAIADRFGSVKTFVLVLFLICAAQFVTIGVSTIWHVYLVAALFGFSMGGNDTVYVKLVVETFGSHFAGAIIGAMSFAFALSSSMGPLIAGFIVDETQSYSWGFITAGVVVLAALMILYFLGLSLRAKSARGSGIVAETSGLVSGSRYP
jgi:MFS family permease